MSQDMESVLKRVAAGELTPEEALDLLGDPAGSGPAEAPAPSAPSAPFETSAPSATSAPSPVHPNPPIYGTAPATATAAVTPAPGLTRLKVSSSYRSLEIVADPQVAQALVTGEHSIQLEDGVMIVTTPGPLDSDSETPLFSFSALPRTLNWIRSWRDRQVRIRVNPAIPLELDLTGVEVTIAGVTAGISGRINASAVKLDSVGGAFDLQTFSASVKGTVIIREDSQIVAESSSMRLTLAAGSDARIEATSRIGRLSLPDDGSPSPRDGETRRFSVGSGEHLLTVESVMSSVTLDTPSWATSA